MRIILYTLTIAALCFGGWFARDKFSPIKKWVQHNISSADFKTLEIRFSAEEIMQTRKNEMLKNQGYIFLEPKLLFYPHLLMEVKYSKNRGGATGEGILLWGLHDGEMVIQTVNWTKTHGFEDCLIAKANKNDFKIMEAIVASGGAIEREKLYSIFNADQEMIDKWIERCRDKKLIVNSGNKYRLHFENPHLEKEPITHFDRPLVTIASKNTRRIARRYSPSEIKKLSQIAFGDDFAIRKTEEVFLPVYEIAVQNPDGSVLSTYWNALNGKKLDKK